MEQAVVDGITIEYEVSGTGAAVVCIHGAFVADTFRPLLAGPSLTERYQLITDHRRGYAGSGRTPGPISLARQAADCLGRPWRRERGAVVPFRRRTGICWRGFPRFRNLCTRARRTSCRSRIRMAWPRRLRAFRARRGLTQDEVVDAQPPRRAGVRRGHDPVGG